jgi:hypothetical protein
MDQDEVDYGDVLAKRYVAGQERDMPNWTVRNGNDLLPAPKLGKDRWLQTDYLLITRIPNILSRPAFASGGELLIVAGTHGIGTEAIGLLLRDLDKLSKIQIGRGNSPYYQCLVPITGIDHSFDGVRMHSVPTRIGEPRTVPLAVDVERIVATWPTTGAH